MAIKIGHASIDEKSKIKGGSAGDQTSKEVCTRSWYSKDWDFVLRPKTSTLAEKSAKACEKGCANANIGYDQNQRNTLHTQASKVKYDLSKIVTKCETDCSAFMTVCAIAGGANIEYGSNGPTTSTMKTRFRNSGDYSVLTASKYLTSDKYLKRGDILVKAGSHTVMALEDGSKSGTTTSTTSTTSSTKVDSAKSYSKSYSKRYTTTAKLNLRTGANMEKSVVVVMPKGVTVDCYGYYTKNSDGSVWMLVHYKSGSKTYTGFCSKNYLK